MTSYTEFFDVVPFSYRPVLLKDVYRACRDIFSCLMFGVHKVVITNTSKEFFSSFPPSLPPPPPPPPPPPIFSFVLNTKFHVYSYMKMVFLVSCLVLEIIFSHGVFVISIDIKNTFELTYTFLVHVLCYFFFSLFFDKLLI